MPRKLWAYRWPAVLAVLLLVGWLAGCANLGAIRSYAEQSADIAGYTKLVNNYIGAKERIASYQPNPQPNPASLLARKEQKEALVARHKIIKTYMDALGQLAADDAVVYDKELTALGSSLQNNKFMEKPEVSAFVAISKLLAKAATDYWRQGKFREIIKEGNAPVQTLVASMKKIVEQGYAGELENESSAIGKFYKKIELESKDPAGKRALLEWQKVHLSTVKTSKEEAAIYVKALGKIGAGHQELYDNLDRLDAKDVLEQMKAYASYLRDAKNALENL